MEHIVKRRVFHCIMLWTSV